MADLEPFVLYAHDGQADLSDELPEGYSYQVWTPTMPRFVPPTMGMRSAIWTLFHWCGLFANNEYRVLYILHGGRIVHRSCVLPRYFRWPFMAQDDLQVGSTWTEPEFRGRGLASAALAHILRTSGQNRRFWYVSRESNVASIHVCRRAGFRLSAYGVREGRYGLRSLGTLVPVAISRGGEPGIKSPPRRVADTLAWYSRYYAKSGSDRNDLRLNRGTLFQTIASERSLVRAFRQVRDQLEKLAVLDVGCGSGGTWYQLFRLGVNPRKTVGIDIQGNRLHGISHLYPQSVGIQADGTSMPFADATFDLVYESTLFATLPEEEIRSGIASEMLRVCKPNGYLLLVDWRTPKFWSREYRALTRREVRKLFRAGNVTSFVGVFRGALVPPIGRPLSKYAEPFYFLVVAILPLLVGQVAFLLRKNPEPPVEDEHIPRSSERTIL